MFFSIGVIIELYSGDATRRPWWEAINPGSLTNVDVGVAYVFDVLQWVPYAGLLVGGYGLAGDRSTAFTSWGAPRSRWGSTIAPREAGLSGSPGGST